MRNFVILNVVLVLILTGCASLASPVVEQPTAVAESSTQVSVELELFAEGFAAPLDMDEIPDGSGRFLLADQVGVISLIEADGTLADEPFLDLRERMRSVDPSYDERGLLGLALHPSYAESGLFYVFYTAPLRESAPDDWDSTIHVSEFSRSPENPDVADPNSERILIELDHPRYNHNGGGLAFGPDGYLYISFGDGGIGGDPNGWVQSLDFMFGKLLRIDVDFGEPYGIPPDNPFVGSGGLEEIYALGFRHPWRFSFDEEYGLILGDVGAQYWEEIDIVEAGGNYGWPIREGIACFDPDGAQIDECASEDERGASLIEPRLVYDHGRGVAVIGGYVYRGEAIPELQGHYVFADWGLGRGAMFLVDPAQLDNQTWTYQFLVTNPDFILSLARDEAGEIYVLTNATSGPGGETGKVYKLVPAN
jgi:glucose/arabinose dehydrogenase